MSSFEKVSQKTFLIQHGEILDPHSNTIHKKDILIEGGKIKAIDAPGKIPASSATLIDASGCWITPGLIDVHVHLREPGQEYKETIETGTRAAVAGGFTSVACMANTYPVNDTPHVTAFIRERVRETSSCRVFQVGAITKGLKGEELAEIGGMVQEGVCALSDDGMPVMNSYIMRKAMDYAKTFQIPVISHAEDENLVGRGVMNEGVMSTKLGLRGNPAAAEEIMVARDIALCRLTGCAIHIAHVSSRLSVAHIIRAKEEGLPVTCEVTPHHLSLTDDCLSTYDTHYKMNPPLRSQEDVECLIKALQEGVIDMIATDHAPHGLVDKAKEFDHAAPGIIGLQTVIPVTLKLVQEGLLSPQRWIDALTLRPAKFLNIPYGEIKVGKTADLTVIDPKKSWKLDSKEICSKSHNTPFGDWNLNGKVRYTLIEGRLIYEE